MHLSRNDFMSNATKFLKKRVIDGFTGINNVYEMFIGVHRVYTEKLRASIDSDIELGLLPKRGNPTFYTYLLFDGEQLRNVLDCYSNSSTVNIENNHFGKFCDSCFYPGKGINCRKFQHAVEAKLVLFNQSHSLKNCARLSKISQLLSDGKGISVVQLFSDSNHYEAHAREYAIIKALGLNNLTNVVNGTPYGIMTSWSDNEVINFGKMSLYNAMIMCILENPRIITLHDIILPNKRTSCKDWELHGILECFLELNTH